MALISKHIKNNRGLSQSTLIVTIAVSTLLVLGVVITLFVGKHLKQREFDITLSKEIAEYGIEIALQEINKNPGWKEGFKNVKYKDGIFSVEIEQKNDSTFFAISKGRINGVEKQISCSYILREVDGKLKPTNPTWR